MALSQYTFVAGKRIQGPVNWTGGLYRSLLYKAASTAAADATTAMAVSDITVLDEYAGVGYVRATLSGKLVVQGAPEIAAQAARYACNPWDWGSPQPDATGAIGFLVYYDPTGADDDTANVPIWGEEDAASPLNGDGSLWTYTPAALGPGLQQ